MADSEVNKLSGNALKGFSNAASYDTHRPSYPLASVENLLQQLHVAGVEGARILDLAAGTGKFTEILAARPEKFDIVAIEPHAEMRAQLQAKVDRAGWSNVRVEQGYAEGMANVDTDWADAVVAAQSFHWFATLEALAEIHRVMAPGTVLGLIWNIEAYNEKFSIEAETDYEQVMKDYIRSLDDKELRYRHFQWPKVFDDQLKADPINIHSANPLFSLPLGEHVDSWQVWLKDDAIWERYQTLSHLANLDSAKREEAKQLVLNTLKNAPRNERGEVALHGKTYAYWTTAIPGETLKSGG